AIHFYPYLPYVLSVLSSPPNRSSFDTPSSAETNPQTRKQSNLRSPPSSLLFPPTMSTEPKPVDSQPTAENPVVAAAASDAPTVDVVTPKSSAAAEAAPAAVTAAAPPPADAPADAPPDAPSAVTSKGETPAALDEPTTGDKKEAETKKMPPETPLDKLAGRLAGIKEKTGHGEMWGVPLSHLSHAPTAIVLQKFLRANNGDVDLAEKQLTDALKWRKETDPIKLLDDKIYDRARFGDLGFVTVHQADDGKEAVITWNVYGGVKNNKATFGNVKEFVEWRAALMEFGVRKLKLNEATAPIPDGADDPYQMIQVHDYMSVSFFRMDPHVKAASKETIQTLSMAYPELLSHKYFVNVPAIMGWVFGAMKLFLSAATLRKFHPMSSGASLANEIKPFAATLPKEYGGSGPSVKEGFTVRLSDAPTPAEDAPKAEAETGDAAPAATEAEAPKVDETPKEQPNEAAPLAEASKADEATAKDTSNEASEEVTKDVKDETQTKAG
ncbi:hypothetical protein jhhlp_000541, partial [Lomentospora prolificans]